MAGPIDLRNVSLFHDGIDYVSKSHSLHFWVKLSVPFPYEKINHKGRSNVKDSLSQS